MYCPFCHHPDTKVVDSRFVPETNKIRRRRVCQCASCRARFTTYEAVEMSLPMVIKQNGNRECFSVEKLRRGLQRAVEKRPVSAEEMSCLIGSIEKRLQQLGEREVESRRIGEWALEGLKQIDQVAYIRFASVYWSFADVESFQKTIAELPLLGNKRG